VKIIIDVEISHHHDHESRRDVTSPLHHYSGRKFETKNNKAKLFLIFLFNFIVMNALKNKIPSPQNIPSRPI